jgi:hypothetical protein
MERRYQPRLPVELQARLTEVDGEVKGIICRIVDVSKSGITVLTSIPITPGSLVRVAVAEDAVFVGRVVLTNPGSETDSGAIARFRTGIAVEYVSVGNTDLSNLLKTLLEDANVTFPVCAK